MSVKTKHHKHVKKKGINKNLKTKAELARGSLKTQNQFIIIKSL